MFKGIVILLITLFGLGASVGAVPFSGSNPPNGTISPRSEESIPSQKNDSPSSGGTFDMEMSSQPFSLLDGRLFITMPEGTENFQAQGDIMGTQPSNQEKSFLLLDTGEQSLVLFAMETFAYTSGDLVSDAKKLWEALNDLTPFQYTMQPLRTEGGYNFAVFEVNNPYNEDGSFFPGGAIAFPPDGTMIAIGIVVNGGGLEEAQQCKELSNQLLASLAPGTRTLNTKPHQEKLGKLSVDVLQDYTVIEENGIDFTVYRFNKIMPLGMECPGMGIYVGDHPSYDDEGLEELQLELLPGTLLGQPVEWRFYSNGTVDRDTYMQTLIPLEGSGYGWLHIFIYPTTAQDLAELRQMAESLTVSHSII